MKRISISGQTFDNLITSKTLYVDKTEYLYNLVSNSEFYFLSRPRRFGKSLTCSTLKAIFSGNKELFKDLWIGKSDYDWTVRPVIYFDFSAISYETPEMLERGLHNALDANAKKYDIILQNTDIKEKFSELIITLGQKITQVAIIIDEYDAPITSLIDNPEQVELSRKILQNFYMTFKGTDVIGNMYFLFITGVTKFAKMSLFSTLNQLNDLTNDNQAAAIVGYTDEEVDLYLSEHIKAFSDKRKESYETTRSLLKTWYNGYRFSDENITVYNPFSLHNCLVKKKLSNFWFSSGTPGFLMKFIENNPKIATEIEMVDGSFYAASELDTLTLDFYYQKYVTLLIQSGYLTFLSTYSNGKQGYRIGYPNEEVRYSMTKQIMEYVGGITPSQFGEFGDRFKKALKCDDLELFCKHMQDFLKLIPHNIRVEKEKFYHQVFFMICALFGDYHDTHQVTTEVATDIGFIDLVLEGTKNTFVVEFKFNGTTEDALKQIEEKGYYKKYVIVKTKKVVLAGITFNETDKGAVVLCEMKEI